MTATTGNSKGLTSEINVTPMIDILLVLLIIFMVIVPAISRGEAALIPQASHRDGVTDAVVLEMDQGSRGAVTLHINQQRVAQGELQSRLAAIYANRAQRALFIKADGQLSFTEIAKVIDISHAAGVDKVGLITPGIAAGR